jgi:hypothetical protein
MALKNALIMQNDNGTTTTAFQIDTAATVNTVLTLGDKQDALVSGTNIKTLNGETLLGSGDIAIASSTLTISEKTAAYTVVAGDLGKIINCTSDFFTVSLDAAATLGAGFNVTIRNNASNYTKPITVDPSGAETIDGQSTLILQIGEGCQIISDGTNWQTGDQRSLQGYAQSTNSTVYTKPTASGNLSVAIGSSCTSSGQFGVAMGFNAQATGFNNPVAIGVGVTASSDYSTAISGNSSGSGSQAVIGAGAMALGGSYASGADSFAAAVGNNSSSYGALGVSSIAMGRTNKSSYGQSYCFGGQSNIASNSYAICVGGELNTASGSYSCTLSGYGNVAANIYSYASGNYASSTINGKQAHASGRFSTTGDAQTGVVVLRRQTTSATPTPLSSDGSTPQTYSQVTLANNSAFAFSGTIVARQSAAQGTASAAWKVEGLIRREGSAGTTVLVNSALTVLSNVPGWDITLTADTTNGGLAITATGAAATNIRWVATIQTSELTYA